METLEKLKEIKSKYSHWNESTSDDNSKIKLASSDCSSSDCSDIGSDCHGDGECGGDGE